MGKVMTKEDFGCKVSRLFSKWKSEFIRNLGDFPIENTNFEEQIQFMEEYVDMMMRNGNSRDNLKRIGRFLDMQTSGENDSLMEIRFIGGIPEEVEVVIETLRDVDVADVHALTEFKTMIVPRTVNGEQWRKKEAAEFLDELREDLESDYSTVRLRHKIVKGALKVRFTLED